MIRKAVRQDLDRIEDLYRSIHDAEEKGKIVTGWIRGVYPTRKTAEEAIRRGDLFVLETEDENILVGCAVINQMQVDVYAGAPWKHAASDEQVCVLHTLVIDPDRQGKGYGRIFLAFYEKYAAEQGCFELRIDTNARNAAARSMYAKHGYEEIAIVPTVFNGIPDVSLVLLEKQI